MLKRILMATGIMVLGLATAITFANTSDARGGSGGGKGMGQGGGQRGGGMLERLDTDGDGQVSRAEYDAHFDKLDTDGNGYVTVGEFDQARADMRSDRRKDRFGQDDADGDGKVSRDEFSGPSRAFSKIDANNDGYITEDELLAYQPVRDRMGGRGGQGGQGMGPGGPGDGQGPDF